MAIYEYLDTFAGRKVLQFPPDEPFRGDPGSYAWRVEDPEYEGDGQFARDLETLTEQPWAGQISALVTGEWGGGYDEPLPVGDLARALTKLPRLEALFLAEMTAEQREISWIRHQDITPLFEAAPQLSTLVVRGSDGLELRPVRHESLRTLVFQTGGLPAGVVRAVGECDFPALTHLELWLGTDAYGGDAVVEDLAAILAGTRLPALTYLGLRNAEIADHVAAALANAPVVARLKVLDLSMGLLGDAGAAALLAGQPLTHLRKLDLHHHFISPAVMQRLAEELVEAGVEVDFSHAGDPEDEDERYIEVSE
jgi:hypothetical protein